MSIATVSTESFSVVIPACNESETVGGLVAQLKAMGAPQIIVVDDGSQDNTAEVARAAGAEVICNPYQMGNGAAIKAGFALPTTKSWFSWMATASIDLRTSQNYSCSWRKVMT